MDIIVEIRLTERELAKNPESKELKAKLRILQITYNFS